MKKRFILVILSYLFMVLIFSHPSYSQLTLKPSGQMVNKIIMVVTLPDDTSFRATVQEDGELIIAKNNEIYSFTPRITNLEAEAVVMEAIQIPREEFNECGSIQFEIIDIISMPNDKFQQRSECSGGRCCVECNGWTACACAAEFAECNEKCCCPACCEEAPEE